MDHMLTSAVQRIELGQVVDLRKVVQGVEVIMLEAALVRTKGNKKAAAKLLTMKRTTLIEKMRRLGNLVEMVSLVNHMKENMKDLEGEYGKSPGMQLFCMDKFTILRE